MTNQRPTALLTINQVCEMLNICRTTLWAMRSRGDFPPGVQVGTQRRWRLSDVERWIDEHSAAAV